MKSPGFCYSTPLQVAAASGSLDFVRLLLAAGADPNDGSPLRTPLSEAALHGHVDIVSELLAAGAVIVLPGRLRNAFASACSGDSFDILDLVLGSLAGTPELRLAIDEVFALALRHGDEEIVFRLLQHVQPNSHYLSLACAAGSVAGVKHFLTAGMSLDDGDEQLGGLLHTAATHLHPNVIEILFDRGSSISLSLSNQGNPVEAALLGCVTPLLRQLRSKRAVALCRRLRPPPDDSRSLCYVDGKLQIASQRVRLCEQVVRMLVTQGVPVEKVCGDFGTPLQLASFLGSEDLVELILENGADVNTTGGYFETAISAALEGGRSAIVRLLLSFGADVHHVHQDFGTVLYQALAKHDVEMFRVLLDHGADPSAANQDGQTPLALALQRRDPHLLSAVLGVRKSLKVRERDILTAAIAYQDAQILDAVLDLDESVMLGEEDAVTVLREPRSPKGIGRLIARNKALGVTEAMLKVAARSAVVHSLLKIRPICKITAEGVQAQREREAIELLLEHEPDLEINEGVVVAVLRTPYRPPATPGKRELLHSLWERNPDLRVTNAVWEAAARSIKDLEFILQQQTAKGMSVPHGALCIAASHPHHAPQLVSLLLGHDPHLQPRQEAIVAAMARHPTGRTTAAVEILLKRMAETERNMDGRIAFRGFGDGGPVGESAMRKRLAAHLETLGK